jgi:hypothetical protein
VFGLGVVLNVKIGIRNRLVGFWTFTALKNTMLLKLCLFLSSCERIGNSYSVCPIRKSQLQINLPYSIQNFSYLCKSPLPAYGHISISDRYTRDEKKLKTKVYSAFLGGFLVK